jgi:hypothetical protein
MRIPLCTNPGPNWEGFVTQENAEKVAEAILSVLGKGKYTIVEMTDGKLGSIRTSQSLAASPEFGRPVFVLVTGDLWHLDIHSTEGLYAFGVSHKAGDEIESEFDCTQVIFEHRMVHIFGKSDSGAILQYVFAMQ